MPSAPSVEFEPYDPAFAADPYPVYARLREETPIFYSSELGMTMFTRYEDIRAVLIDSGFGRSLDHVSTREEIERRRHADGWDRMPNYSRYVHVNLLEREGPDHTRIRKLVSAALDPRRIRKLRDPIQLVVDELLRAAAAAGRVEFVSEIAVPLPVHMISELLGWPEGERHRLRPWSAAIVRLYEKDYGIDDEARAEQAVTEFAAMLNELADRRRVEPRADLISALVSVQSDGLRLTRDELIATCMLLLNAGHEATVNAAGNGLLALLQNPRQFDRLRNDRSLLPTAIEEMIRYDAPLQLFHRFALADREYKDVKLRKGDSVGLLYGSANRDPYAFEYPDEFDVGRSPNRHFGFGTGSHFCLGAPLARLELDVLIGTFLERFSDVHLEGEVPRYRAGLVFRGLDELRVRVVTRGAAS
jgi:cytochrome P450